MPSRASLWRAEDDHFHDTEEFMMGFLERMHGMGATSVNQFGTDWPLPRIRSFENMIEAQVYVDGITGSTWAKEQFPRVRSRTIVKPLVHSRNPDGSRYEYAYTQGANIFIPDHTASSRSRFMNELWLLHELAHRFTPDPDSRSAAHHDALFVDVYFKLVEYQIDPMFAMYYKICHTEHRKPLGAS